MLMKMFFNPPQINKQSLGAFRPACRHLLQKMMETIQIKSCLGPFLPSLIKGGAVHFQWWIVQQLLGTNCMANEVGRFQASAITSSEILRIHISL